MRWVGNTPPVPHTACTRILLPPDAVCYTRAGFAPGYSSVDMLCKEIPHGSVGQSGAVLLPGSQGPAGESRGDGGRDALSRVARCRRRVRVESTPARYSTAG